ncbi:UDP-N-acetylmuramoyl-L-alanyl-D-glutamate--2,6-diaminopimelate ligase [Dermabacter sp. HSID17554]|nr:UDP-N-acetylmuramoyl-L-alanyl-D-glutamate--2,6-diaminopimelate ligase [Dermabacter sp. HSID17554]
MEVKVVSARTNLMLGDLARQLEGAPGSGALELRGESVPISSVTIDSRKAGEKALFVAVQGENAHGASYAGAALAQGCRAILTDEAGASIVSTDHPEIQCALLLCEDPRALAGFAANLVYGKPSHEIPLVGVTGTNGKTSVTTMCARTLQELGENAGIVGTNGTFLAWAGGREEKIPTERTTPEATDVHALLRHMVNEGMTSAALEVSSHAMVLHRVAGVSFDVAVFTNLSQDHLDFHKDMEDYFEAKASLFTPVHARRGIVCVDDEWGRRLAKRATIPVTTYSAYGHEADFTVGEINRGEYGTVFTVQPSEGAPFTLESALPGTHYVANTLAVALVLRALGCEGEKVRTALAAAGTVPGRMERVGQSDACPRVVVDYSHTPDALEHALETLHTLENVGEIVTVFGAGGHRDALKRPLMGEVAARLSDRVFVTDDNPRDEEPALIRQDVLAGIPEGSRARVENVGDRAEAIARAIGEAKINDVVLIAGKGAESGQVLADRTIDFDDRVHARDALRTWAKRNATRTMKEEHDA